MHVLAPFLLTGGPGSAPFIDFSAKTATDDLREIIDILEIPGAQNYRPHDLRRAGYRWLSLQQQVNGHQHGQDMLTWTFWKMKQ